MKSMVLEVLYTFEIVLVNFRAELITASQANFSTLFTESVAVCSSVNVVYELQHAAYAKLNFLGVDIVINLNILIVYL